MWGDTVLVAIGIDVVASFENAVANKPFAEIVGDFYADVVAASIAFDGLPGWFPKSDGDDGHGGVGKNAHRSGEPVVSLGEVINVRRSQVDV